MIGQCWPTNLNLILKSAFVVCFQLILRYTSLNIDMFALIESYHHQGIMIAAPCSSHLSSTQTVVSLFCQSKLKLTCSWAVVAGWRPGRALEFSHPREEHCTSPFFLYLQRQTGGWERHQHPCVESHCLTEFVYLQAMIHRGRAVFS